MAVQQRRPTGYQQQQDTSSTHADEAKAKAKHTRHYQLAWIFCALLFLAVITDFAGILTPAIRFFVAPSLTEQATVGQYHVLHKRQLSPQAELILYLSRPDQKSDTVLLGPHTVTVTVAKGCSYPRFFLRAQGDALAHVPLTQTHGNNQWNGVFYLPVNGSYSIDARWYGCDFLDTHSYTTLSDAMSFRAEGSILPASTHDPNYYAGKLLAQNTAWISTKNMRIGVTTLPPYMWMKVDGEPPSPGSFVKTSASLVHQGAVLGPNGYYQFGEVGNYELVCFMGSQTMQKIWRAFMDMRGHLFAHQRPFKFHFYDIYSLTRPDEHWEVDTKRRLRKCKHMLLALDDFQQPLSQLEYKEQVVRFVNIHLQNVIPDKTFPIWVFSVNEPPMNTIQCFEPKLPRTTDHPCNDVLKDLFRAQPKVFDDRIHFLDNTDLSLPQFDLNEADVLANIALRVYVIVGKGVSVWRHMGQSGKEDGLHRNGTVEPNFELVPYDGWS